MTPPPPARSAWPSRLVILAATAAIAFAALRPDSEDPEVEAPAAPDEKDLPPLTGAVFPTLDPRAAPAVGITGTVRGEDEAPLAGAQVCAFPRSPFFQWLAAELRAPSCALSGPDGYYAIEGLIPGRWAVHASAPQHLPGSWPGPGGRSDLSLKPGEVRPGVDLRLAGGGALLAGVVRDATGGVIEGAWVFNHEIGALYEAPGGLVAGRTDATGAFSLWVRPGMTVAFAQAEGYTDGYAFGLAPSRALKLVLTPESALIGRVVEAGTGAPVAGARVAVQPDYTDGGYAAASGAQTGADGRFRVGRLMPGRYKPTVVAEGRYGEAARGVVLGLGETSDELVIEVHPAARIEGKVVFARSGEPCHSGQVMLNNLGGGMPAFEQLEDGVARFPAVLPGTYEVGVTCPGAVTKPTYGRLEIGADDQSGLVWEVEAGRTIRGVVVDAGGKPVVGISASANMTQPPEPAPGKEPVYGGGFDDATDSAGRFEISGLPPGTYAVQAFGEGVPPTREGVTVEVPEDRDVEDVRISLDPQGGLRGVVVDDRGDPVAGVMVNAQGEGYGSGQSGDDGSFELRGLLPGDYQVRADRPNAPPVVSPDGTLPDAVPAKVVVGEVTEVRLVVPSARGELRGRVLEPDGAPAVDAYVTAVREPEGEHVSPDMRQMARWTFSDSPVLVDQDGNFTLDRLLDGRYTIRAYRRGGGEAFAEHVRTGESATLTIEPPSALGGSMRGEPPEAFAVAVFDAKTMVGRTEEYFRTGGRWGIDGLPAGTYEVRVEAPGGSATLTVTLRPGESREDLEVDLVAPGRVRGRAVDAETGAPLAGFRVYGASSGARTRYGNPVREIFTGSDGHFEIDGLAPGEGWISVSPVEPWGEYMGGHATVTIEAGRTIAIPDIQVPKMPADMPHGPHFKPFRRH